MGKTGLVPPRLIVQNMDLRHAEDQLARAVYGDADFNFLDAHTGAYLFKKFLQQLLSQKIVVYVTRQEEILGAPNIVLVMKDGRIVQSGKFGDPIANSYAEPVRLMDAHTKSLIQVSSHQHDSSSNSAASPANEIEVVEENFEGRIKNEKLVVRAQEEVIESSRVK